MASTQTDILAAKRAFTQVMSDHGGLIYSVCRFRLSTSFGFAVEDAAAETALRLYRAIERQVVEGRPVQCNRTFIRLVATRTAITVFNQHVRQVEQQRRLVNELSVSDPRFGPAPMRTDDAVSIVADLADDELALLLKRLPVLIGRLPSRDQSLLRLYYLTTPPLTWDAIGERLDIQPAAARQAGRRALKKLSKLAHTTLNGIRRGEA